ncbi:hypothetical protein Micbo1qcDRAFT_160621 [Microdochium bolleyi]|uniref:Uncharacterized protein n=1 Tax=Microdochium bolleyi TaxID=196109 RepID=A0A136J6J6_9PEZI|nr:hypothetical protein Micbo1qcDRAFT_160621 [Microdochium bolleyi]
MGASRTVIALCFWLLFIFRPGRIIVDSGLFLSSSTMLPFRKRFHPKMCPPFRWSLLQSTLGPE